MNCLKLFDYLYKMNLALNNFERIIYHKTQPTNQQTNQISNKIKISVDLLYP